METIRIGLIIGSTRDGRFGEHAGAWINEIAGAQPAVEIDLIDLKEIALPFFTDAMSPAWKTEHSDPQVKAFAERIARCDAFIVTVAEYNHGYTAALKNALDIIYHEWNNKPIAFVGYGSVGGGRAVEQLRQVAVELQMAPIRNAVHIMAPWTLREENGDLKAGALDSYTESAQNMMAQLSWWAHALKTARTQQ